MQGFFWGFGIGIGTYKEGYLNLYQSSSELILTNTFWVAPTLTIGLCLNPSKNINIEIRGGLGKNLNGEGVSAPTSIKVGYAF